MEGRKEGMEGRKEGMKGRNEGMEGWMGGEMEGWGKGGEEWSYLDLIPDPLIYAYLHLLPMRKVKHVCTSSPSSMG